MVRPRAVLFDIGSTLWSSPTEDPGALLDCYGRGYDILRADLGPGVPSTDDLIRVVEGCFAQWEDTWKADNTLVTQEPTSVFVGRALKEIGVEPSSEALQAFTDVILQVSVGTAKVEPHEPGMREALAALKERGLVLACVSNAFMGADVLNAIMAERGLGPYLELTVSSCELGFRKPHPAIYQAALDKLGVRGEEAVFVGDRLDADIEGPSKLGMRGVLTHQYRIEDPATARVAPDAVIKHLSELVPYIDTLLV